MKILKVKPFRQSASFCGPASLKMILSYYGVKISEKKVAQATQTKKYHGTPAQRIVEGAKKLGFEAELKDYGTWEDLEYFVNKKKIPVIVNWFSEYMSHYSVVVGIDKNKIVLLDPEEDKKQSFSKFKFHCVWFNYTGVPYPSSPDDLRIRRMVVVYPHT